MNLMKVVVFETTHSFVLQNIQKKKKFNIYQEATRNLTVAEVFEPFGGKKIEGITTGPFIRFTILFQMIVASSRLFQALDLSSTNFLLFNTVLSLLEASIAFTFAAQTKTLPIPNLLDAKSFNQKNLTAFLEALVKGGTIIQTTFSDQMSMQTFFSFQLSS